MSNSQDPPFSLFTFSQFDELLGDSSISEYFKDYLSHFTAKTCIRENNYIDRDYIIDYSKFYARAFSDISKTTSRYHFFTKEFTEVQFITALESNEKEAIEPLKQSYLGFIVKKEIKDPLGKYLFGRTLIRTYEDKDNKDRRVFLRHPYNVNLFGLKLHVETLPFQQQDVAVGACATVACWISHFPLQQLFDTQAFSPIEVTEKAIIVPSESRNFPSEGLTLEQMKSFFNAIGMDTEFIRTDISQYGAYTKKDDIIADAVKAYITYGLPVIAGLYEGESDNNSERHAVVISGFRHRNGKLIEIYIHDDGTGPYHRIKPQSNGKFKSWRDNHPEYGDIKWSIHFLFVPIYPKIRLSFSRMYREYLRAKRNLEGNIRLGQASKNSTLDLILTDVKKYKEFLISQPYSNKIESLTTPLPRFLWIIRGRNRDDLYYDLIYDGTAVFPEKKCEVNFISEDE